MLYVVSANNSMKTVSFSSLKEQLLHLFFGLIYYTVIAVFAIALDLAAIQVKKLGVSEFTYDVLVNVSHCVLVLDVILFFIYLLASFIGQVKEMYK